MRVKRELNIRGVDRIKGLTSKELADHCPDGRQVFPVSPCTNCSCDYVIDEPGYMNCTFVAAEVSEHTLEAIGDMMNITREGVRLIERRALLKVKIAMANLQKHDDNPSLREQGPPSGSDHVDTHGQGSELSDPSDSVPAINGRRLAQFGR